LILLAAPALAGPGTGKTFLIHAKTSLKLDDAQICADYSEREKSIEIRDSRERWIRATDETVALFN